MKRWFGNVTEDTEFTFEYKMKPVGELLKLKDIDMAAIDALPFQAQIHYFAMDGSKCIRVITN